MATSIRDYLGTLSGDDGVIVNDDGSLTLMLDSSMLPGVSVDTYGTFTGEGVLDSEIEYLFSSDALENALHLPYGSLRDYDPDTYPSYGTHYDVLVDHEGVLDELTTGAIEDLLVGFGEYGDWSRSDKPLILDVDGVSTYSPTFYNFTTDGFTALYTVSPTALADNIAHYDPELTAEGLQEWAEEHWASGPGFHSYIPRHFLETPEWAHVWSAIAYVLVHTEYDNLMGMLEHEDAAYRENAQIKLTAAGYEYLYQQITGDADGGEGLASWDDLRDVLVLGDPERFTD